MALHAGVNYFDPASGAVENLYCKACLELLDVQRDVLRTKGRYGPLPEQEYRKVDVFTCRFSEEIWHEQIIALLRESEKTASLKISDIIKSEIEEIRKTRTPTKERGYW